MPCEKIESSRVPEEKSSRRAVMARLASGSTARSLLATSGRTRFARESGRASGVVLDPELYTVASMDSLGPQSQLAAGVGRGAAYRALKFAAGATAGLQVVPDHELATS